MQTVYRTAAEQEALSAAKLAAQHLRVLDEPSCGGLFDRDCPKSCTIPMCQRRLRQSLPDILVPMGGEWFLKRAEVTPCS